MHKQSQSQVCPVGHCPSPCFGRGSEEVVITYPEEALIVPSFGAVSFIPPYKHAIDKCYPSWIAR
jgi:hypothetical protein